MKVFKSLEQIPIENNLEERWAYLLATDIAFIGLNEKRLSVIPTKGEKMSFLWDLARHIFRTTELGYRTGDHRKDPGRRKLIEIFNKIQFKKVENVFGELNRLYWVDEVFLMRRGISHTLHSPELRKLAGTERFEELEKSLLVSTKHGSTFWHKQNEKLQFYVQQIINSLDPNNIPDIYEIRFSTSDPDANSRYYDQISNIIKTKENPVTGEIMQSIIQIKGIAFHNEELIGKLNHVEEIRLLVTSGEKIFNEKKFWEQLSKVKKTLILKILMLNPDSPATQKRQDEAYDDKPADYLAEEIRENLVTITRMRIELEKKKSAVKILCSLYDELPPFRLTFIGTETLLVTAYDKDKRTGKETEFYRITHQQMGPIFDGFSLDYDALEAKSKMV